MTKDCMYAQHGTYIYTYVPSSLLLRGHEHDPKDKIKKKNNMCKESFHSSREREASSQRAESTKDFVNDFLWTLLTKYGRSMRSENDVIDSHTLLILQYQHTTKTINGNNNVTTRREITMR